MTSTASLRLAVRCPSCSRTPKLRTFPGVRDWFRSRMDPDSPVQTIECNCGERYVITVRAFQEAA